MIHLNIYQFIFLIIFSEVTYLTSEVIKFETIPPKNGEYYQLGESLNLSCYVKNSNGTVIFAKSTSTEKEFYSENTIVYRKNGVITIKPISHDVKVYNFIVYKLEWNQNGTWLCLIKNNGLSIDINIKVIGKLNPLRPDIIINRDKTDDSSNLLLGRGTRTMPYDLMRGATLKIICSAECSSFHQKFQWTIKNVTGGSLSHLSTIIGTETASSNLSCTYKDDEGKGYISQSEFKVNCADLSLVGSNLISCSRQRQLNTQHQIQSPPSESQSLYVLCSGGQLEAWPLTSAEIIGIALALLIGLCVLMVIGYSIRQLMRHTPYKYCGGGGTGAGSSSHNNSCSPIPRFMMDSTMQGIRV